MTNGFPTFCVDKLANKLVKRLIVIDFMTRLIVRQMRCTILVQRKPVVLPGARSIRFGVKLGALRHGFGESRVA